MYNSDIYNQSENKGFIKMINEFNYFTESTGKNKKSPLYTIYNDFIVTNKNYFTIEQLELATANLLSPNAFDDSIIRSEEEYYNTINNIKNIKQEKLINQNEQGRSK